MFDELKLDKEAVYFLILLFSMIFCIMLLSAYYVYKMGLYK